MVRALDARTGKQVWSFVTRARVESSPAIAGGRVYVGSNDNHLYVLDAATGRKLFEYDAGGAVPTSPALADGKVIIGTQAGDVLALGG
jgi:outer membrane protein assembly factor BamB